MSAQVAAGAGEGGATGMIFMFIQMWMAVLQTILVPLEPLLRLQRAASSGAPEH